MLDTISHWAGLLLQMLFDQISKCLAPLLDQVRMLQSTHTLFIIASQGRDLKVQRDCVIAYKHEAQIMEPYLVSQIVVLKIAIPGGNVQLCPVRYELLHSLCKLL